jgi:hypothetical protein
LKYKERFEFDDSLNYAKNCYTNDINSWPSPKQMNLDDSQYEALKLALTKKIAIIQGLVYFSFKLCFYLF